MTQTKKKLKFLPMLALCGTLSAVGTFGAVKVTSAFFTSSENHTNTVGFANNEHTIEEPDFDPETKTDEGVTEYKKSVSVKNTGNIPVYVRAMVRFSDPFAADMSEITNSAGTFKANELDAHLPEGWVKGSSEKFGDYYYYTKPVAAGQSTNEIIQKVKTTFPAGSEKFDYDIYVLTESVQTKRTVGTETKDLTWEEAWDGFIG